MVNVLIKYYEVNPRTGHKSLEGEHRYSLFNLGTRWGQVVITSQLLYPPLKEIWDPFYRKVGGLVCTGAQNFAPTTI